MTNDCKANRIPCTIVTREFRRVRVPVIPVEASSLSLTPAPRASNGESFVPTTPNSVGNTITYPTNLTMPNTIPMQTPNTFRWPPESSHVSGLAANMANPLSSSNNFNSTSQPQQQAAQTATPMNTILPHNPCPACELPHPRGSCPLKIAGTEFCPLCGLAHYGHTRTCPHLSSETQVREMLAALKSSPETKELVAEAKRYLRGRKGTLVQRKKAEKSKREYEKGPGGELDRESGIVGFGRVAESVGFKG